MKRLVIIVLSILAAADAWGDSYSANDTEQNPSYWYGCVRRPDAFDPIPQIIGMKYADARKSLTASNWRPFYKTDREPKEWDRWAIGQGFSELSNCVKLGRQCVFYFIDLGGVVLRVGTARHEFSDDQLVFSYSFVCRP